ncbi:hypothetical protein C7C56_026190 [Massilia glaciei]|uniref:Uncharacterized protein n=2 Tax=Massilia glaciei TaxID=1524097 RepID=A0A2U2HC11_9BURK|nr:hypothetical protein C7C56_026190 [Massilia glaciei]
MEIDFAQTDLYAKLRKSVTLLDGNIAGTADLMMYVVAYLKAARESDRAGHEKISKSPLLLTHLQRVWSEAERVVAAADEFSVRAGGFYHVPEDVLAFVSSADSLAELDRIGIEHPLKYSSK